MLAGETAVGAYPVRAVETLHAIIVDAESIPPAEHMVPDVDPTGSLHGRALCEAAVTLSSTGQADAIVAVTRAGKTARLLSSLRPAAPIFGVTDNERVAGALALFWGVTPVITGEHAPEALERVLLERLLIPPGAVVVYINVSPRLDRNDGNFLRVRTLG
jgi:pyruvate kinase